MSAPLIINTRPVNQARALTDLLQDNNFRVMELPLIEINSIVATNRLPQIQIDNSDFLVFISANAVIFYFKYFILPAKAKIAVIGKSTAEIFAQYAGQKADIIPDRGSDSESLLSHKDLLAIEGLSIIIVRGKGGREYLAQQLRERQAKVVYLETYIRACPKYEQKFLSDIWHKQTIGFMIISSVESVENLLQLSQHFEHHADVTKVLKTNLIVIHNKIKEKITKYGFFGKILVPDTTSNLSIVQTLHQYYKATN
ncbi:MAG: uroporphyrinogen-III synthase [Pseudomonadota bacterium]